jgi:hypothetical protein
MTVENVKIKIIDDNLTKICDVLDRAHGRARRHVATPGDLFALANRAEETLTASGLLARERAGAEVVWNGAGPSARAYGYKMTRTRITLLRGVNAWFLTKAERVGVRPGQSELYHVPISPAQGDRITAVALAPFRVRDIGESNEDRR